MTLVSRSLYDVCGMRRFLNCRYPAWAVQGSNLRPPACKAASVVLRSYVARSVRPSVAAFLDRVFVSAVPRRSGVLRCFGGTGVGSA